MAMGNRELLESVQIGPALRSLTQNQEHPAVIQGLDLICWQNGRGEMRV